MADLASPAELRDFLQAPAIPENAAKIALAGVSKRVRGYCRRAFAATENEIIRLDGTGSRTLLLPNLPVAEVTEVVEAPGDATYELELIDGTNFEWNEDGILRRLDGGRWVPRLRYYRVTYSHGEDVPDDVKLVVLRICARAVVNPEGLSQENAAGYGSTFGFDESRLAVLSKADKAELADYRISV